MGQREADLRWQEEQLAARRAALAEAQQLRAARHYREARRRLQTAPVTAAGGLTEEQIHNLKEIRRLEHILRGLFGLSGTQPVTSVAFSPQPTDAAQMLLASGTEDGRVWLWRVSDGSLVRILGGHLCDVRSIAFSPGGKILTSGSRGGTVKLWDVATGRELRTLMKGHTGTVWSTAFSRDGEMLASGAYGGAVRLWRVSDGTFLRVLEGHGHTDSVDHNLQASHAVGGL